MTRILGLGHDVASVAQIEEQLGSAGSSFSEAFSVRERRQASRKAQSSGDSMALHLAACWAGKECVVKAWTEALGSADFPVSLDAFQWESIEILSNSKGCPAVELSSDYERLLADSLAEADPQEAGQQGSYTWKISLSHEAGLASGVALLCFEEGLSI